MAATAAAGQEKQQLTAEQARLKVMSHPARERLLRHWIEKGVTSPVEASHALKIDLTTVSYHVRVLRDIGILEEVETEPVRGSTKHYLRATDRHLVDEPEWEELEPLTRDFVVAGSLQPLIGDFVKAAKEGTFRDPAGDFILSRIPVKGLDAQGYEELMGKHRELYDETYEIQKRASQRMKVSGEEPIMATSGQAIWRMSGF